MDNEPINESTIPYRFGDWGPKYLSRGPRLEFGMVVLKAGQDFPSHYHERVEESFYTLEGTSQFYADGKQVTLRSGDYFRIEPGTIHYVVNTGTETWKAVFVKSIHDPQDKVDVSWLPGQPLPKKIKG
jgi:quercetin dioxygenase-like cupin family protein